MYCLCKRILNLIAKRSQLGAHTRRRVLAAASGVTIMSSLPLKRLLKVFVSDRPQLEAAVYQRVHCSATTADVMQDTWLKLEAVGEEATIENAEGFVRRVAQNAATDHVRKERRRSTIDHEVHGLLWETETEFTPERILMGRQALKEVEGALATLPEQSRRIFLMNRFDGQTHREIAAQLRISETAVYYHVRRVLEHLAAVRERFAN